MQRASAGRFRAMWAAVLTLAVAAAVLASPGSSGTNEVGADNTTAPLEIGSGELTGDASKFIPITPIRALDTRVSNDYARVFRESSISLDPVTDTGVAAAAGVEPDDITAVVVNTTVVKAGGRGFATMWPTGSERLETATNNTDFEGHNIGNLVIAPLGLERKISFYASTDAHVTIDVLGVFVASGATDAGRFEQLGPVRHTDTREGTPMGADETRVFDLTTVGVPEDATGAVMNITAFRSNGPGFYTVWAADTPRPNTANINVLAVDYAAGNQVVSGLTDGRIAVYTDVGSQLTIDVTGYFTASGGDASTDGLFVPFSPDRFLDTREPNGEIGLNAGQPLDADERFALELAGRGDVPEVGVKAVALNITGVQAPAAGFVKAFPSTADEPETSSLNFTQAGQTVPNHAITSIDVATGAIDLMPNVPVHVVVDATGYFLSENGVVPPPAEPSKVVDPGEFVPAPLGDAPPAEPYDFLFDRSNYVGTGQRPNPTIDTAYDACVPIRYALNIDLADDEAIADLIASVEEVELYTGIDFQYAGVTSGGMNISDEILLPETFDPPLDYRYLPPGADVVIGYTNGSDTPETAGGVIGVGGGIRIPDEERMFRGFATIDLPDLRTSEERKATTTHEMGHMMGLGHVSDFDPRSGAPSTAYQGLDPSAGTWSNAVLQSQLMYPQLTATTSFSPGDIHGLWQLYGTQSCGNSLVRTDVSFADDVDWSSVELVHDH